MSFYAQIYIFWKLYNNVRTVNQNNFTFFLPVMLNSAVKTLISDDNELDVNIYRPKIFFKRIIHYNF